jgi:hypothetical protein
MGIIGRRLVLNWGSRAIAIEKLAGSAADHGVGETVSMLQDIYGNAWSNDIYFVDLESDTVDYPGRTVNHYLQTKECWMTAAEKEMRRSGK